MRIPTLAEIARAPGVGPIAALLLRPWRPSGDPTAHVETLARSDHLGEIPGPAIDGRWVGLVRVYPPGLGYATRDPFRLAFVAVNCGARTVAIKGVCKSVRRSEGHAIQRALMQLGFEAMRAERRNGGRARVVRMDRRHLFVRAPGAPP